MSWVTCVFSFSVLSVVITSSQLWYWTGPIGKLSPSPHQVAAAGVVRVVNLQEVAGDPPKSQ